MNRADLAVKVKITEHFDPYVYRRIAGSGIELRLKEGNEYIFFLRGPVAWSR